MEELSTSFHFLSENDINNNMYNCSSNNEIKGVTKSLLTDAFFQSVLGSRGTVISWKPFEVPCQRIGLTTTCKATQSDDRMIGHRGFEISYTPSYGGTATKTLRVVAKCKPLAARFVDIFGDWIKQQTGEVSQYAEMFRHVSYFRKSDVREIRVMRTRDQRFTDIAPKVYHTVCNPSKEVFVIVMEDLTGHVTHFNTIDIAPQVWNHDDIKIVLRDIARFHSIHLDDVARLSSEPWMCLYSGSVMKALSGFWRALLHQNHVSFPDLWTTERTRLVNSFIDNLDRVWQVIESFPRTLVHYDFTPRNVCIRKEEIAMDDKQNNHFITDSKLSRISCIYDWEMATIHAPQHDVVEFLAFVLPAKCDVTTRTNFVRFYQEQLETFSGRTFDSEQFMEVFKAVCCVYALHQLSLKTITHSVTRLPYFGRAMQSHMGFLEDLEAKGCLESINNDPLKDSTLHFKEINYHQGESFFKGLQNEDLIKERDNLVPITHSV
ncbi:uncharacterized protein LOC144641508 [Oculina patagonica]